MARYELTGVVKTIMEPVTFASGFTKREFVVTTEEERFPQDIKFECVKDRCALLDPVTAGQRVTVAFDIRGNEYKGRYFVSLSAWKIVPAKDDDNGPGPAGVPLEEALPEEGAEEEEPPF